MLMIPQSDVFRFAPRLLGPMLRTAQEPVSSDVLMTHLDKMKQGNVLLDVQTGEHMLTILLLFVFNFVLQTHLLIILQIDVLLSALLVHLLITQLGHV